MHIPALAAILNREYMSSLVLIDESIKEVDKACTRYAFGHVIIDSDTASDFEQWLADNVESDTLRFSLKGKLHFTELSPAQRHILVEKISKLPITFKVYVTYVSRNALPDVSATKKGLLTRSMLHHEKNKPNSEYIVEQSDEYKTLPAQLKNLKVSTVAFPDMKALLLPDVLLGVFCGFLDIQNPAQSTDMITWHTLIYNQIRLEVIDFQPKARQYLRRGDKIA